MPNKRKRRRYSELATVESQRNDLVPEEFPEGPYGADMLLEMSEESNPKRADQDSPNPYSYENKDLHEKLPRNYPGADPTEN